METLYQLLAVVGAGLIVWFIYKSIKGQPDQFSREKINKSLLSMGILGLFLIAFVTLHGVARYRVTVCFSMSPGGHRYSAVTSPAGFTVWMITGNAQRVCTYFNTC